MSGEDREKSKGNAIGIDLGTYNSAAAVMIGDEIVMIESKHGKTKYGKQFPSFVLFDSYGEKKAVGKLAKAELNLNPELVIWGVKRFIGLAYKDAKEKGEFRRFNYPVESGANDKILIKVGEERYSPQHILEFVLKEIKEDSEKSLKNKLRRDVTIEKAVIGVPAYYLGPRTNPIINAAKDAGYKEVKIITEPTAAAINYSLKIKNETNVLTFDIGAGTLDVTVLQIIINKKGEICTGEQATSGNNMLGGIDIDDLILRYLKKKYKLNIKPKSQEESVLRDELENAKMKLSTRDSTMVELPNGEFIKLTQKNIEKVLNIKYKRINEDEPRSFFERIRNPIRVALRQAEEQGIEINDIDYVLFVGGPSQIPSIRKNVKDELIKLGAKKELIEKLESLEEDNLPVNPMECVAKGACLYAGGKISSVMTIPEGYGTVLGARKYSSIIEVNSSYPTDGETLIAYYNPTAKILTTPIIAKRIDQDRSHDANKYIYEKLGDFTIPLKKIKGEYPKIQIIIDFDDNKKMITTLIQYGTKNQVSYDRLDNIKGERIDLREDPPLKKQKSIKKKRRKDEKEEDEEDDFEEEEDKPIRPPPPPPPPPDDDEDSGWTDEHINKLIRSSQSILNIVQDNFGEEPEDENVRSKKEDLEVIIYKIEKSKFKDPNEDGPKIYSKISELLHSLRLEIQSTKNEKEKKRLEKIYISEDEYNFYKNELEKITKD